ncbi:MAG: hypothetical protein AB7O67_11365 [Vicinamibacterales bacterium]
MSAALWTTQIVLALLAFAGGAYKLTSFDTLATMPAAAALTRGGAGLLGGFEMLCAVLLIAPMALRWMPSLTPLAAAALAVESLALAALYSRYSLAMAPDNPLVWVLLIALMAGFVAYGRGVRS